MVPFNTLLSSTPPVIGGAGYQLIFLPTKNGVVWDVTGATCAVVFTRPDNTTFQVSATVITAPAPYNTTANPTGFAYVTAVSYTTLGGTTPDFNQAGDWSADCNVILSSVNIWFGPLRFAVGPR
jgi:hypothetical protein